MKKMMKKGLFCVLLFMCIAINAQSESEKIERKNELKINAAYLLGGVPEISYERLIKDDQGIGVSFAFSIEDNNFYDFIFTPYYRLYFGKKQAAGFFMEANASFFSERASYDDYYYDQVNDVYVEESTEHKLGGGLGLAIGGKFIAKNSWVGEIYGGVGRNFANNDQSSSFSVVYPRFGISLGKRF